jgi:hypothetical protein
VLFTLIAIQHQQFVSHGQKQQGYTIVALPYSSIAHPQRAAMASLQRLLRPGSSRTALLQRLALQKAPSTAVRTSAFHTTAPPQFALTRQAARLPRRIANNARPSHGVAKRAMALRANMATAAPTPPQSTATATAPQTQTPSSEPDTSAGAGKGPPWLSYVLSQTAFAPEVAEILRRRVDQSLIEIKPDGIIYLPEIWYRSILFDAFGPGAWVMIPLGPPSTSAKVVTRQWALMVHGRWVPPSPFIFPPPVRR